MSCNRENVTWQSEDGTWSRGFFDFYDVGSDDENWDYEWGVEYSHDEFCWVTTGHPTREDAEDVWQGANPGGRSGVPYSAENAEQCARYDKMAAALKAQGGQGYDGAWGFVR
jgi:hypothetical protein